MVGKVDLCEQGAESLMRRLNGRSRDVGTVKYLDLEGDNYH